MQRRKEWPQPGCLVCYLLRDEVGLGGRGGNESKDERPPKIHLGPMQFPLFYCTCFWDVGMDTDFCDECTFIISYHIPIIKVSRKSIYTRLDKYGEKSIEMNLLFPFLLWIFVWFPVIRSCFSDAASIAFAECCQTEHGHWSPVPQDSGCSLSQTQCKRANPKAALALGNTQLEKEGWRSALSWNLAPCPICLVTGYLLQLFKRMGIFSPMDLCLNVFLEDSKCNSWLLLISTNNWSSQVSVQSKRLLSFLPFEESQIN